jgi:hypothetical protein
MVEQTLGENIILVDFNLDDQEMVVIKKIVGNYAKKIQNIIPYQELKLELKNHKKNQDKAIRYELKAHLIIDKAKANTQVEGLNPFMLVDEALKKILSEIEHKTKKW